MKNRFLEIGDSQSVFLREVVLVLDADTATVSRTTREFLKKNEKNLAPAPKGIKMVNSFILTNAFGTDRIYQSAYTSKRIGRNADKVFVSSFPEKKEAKEVPDSE